MEIIEAFIAVIIQEEQQKTEEMEGGRTLATYGNISRCNTCESIYHWSTECPEKRYEAEISLFSNDIQECYMTEILKETMNCAVLGSGCTRTICGDVWLKVFSESLNTVDAAKIIEMKSTTRVHFFSR